jgi:hypothetical protein
MKRRSVAWALPLMAAAGCHVTDAMGDGADAAVPYTTPSPTDADRDHDHLCDDSEQELGTNPDKADSDDDAWPDVIEAIIDTDPHDPNSPSRDQVGYLMPDPGTLDFDAAITAHGDGAGVSGEFIARNGLDRSNRRAGDYFRSLTATGAEPPDNVRGEHDDAGHFDSILGATRLSFRLRFALTSAKLTTCAAALPFDLALKSDTGGVIGTRRYVLVVTDEEPPLIAADFCLPVGCL